MKFDLLHLIFLLTAFAGITAAIIFKLKQKNADLPNEELIGLKKTLEFNQNQIRELHAELEVTEQKLEGLNRNLVSAVEKNASDREKIENLEAIKAEFGQKISALEGENKKLAEANASVELSAAKVSAEKKALEESIKQQQQFITEAQKNLATQFENISNKQLEAHSEKFIKNSADNLGNLLNPLKENIDNFKKEIAETYSKEARERFALGKEIERIVDVNNKMTSTTENLTKALKGDRKMQGNWGEMLLEKLLEDSGLKKDTHYTAQTSFKNEEGDRQLPDFIIKLPEGKHIIVDSKVSLVSYERYFNEESDEAKIGHARGFVDSVKAHVKGLSSKRYQDNKEASTLDFVIMFMPIEGTFQFLTQHAADIFQFGWANKVVITSPVTLFPVLQTISSIWKVEAQNRNTQEIIKTATSLYDKFVNLGLSIEEIGKHIEKSEDAYKTAIKRLNEGERGSIINTVKKLESFGIDKKGNKKGNKKIPTFMQGDEGFDAKQKSAEVETALFGNTESEEAA